MRSTLRHRVATSLPPELATALKNPWRIMRDPLILTTVSRGSGAPAQAPWWNKRAIGYLGQRLHRGDRAFEWGSGSSTSWLVQNGVTVTSVEHDPEWAGTVTGSCPDSDIRLIPGQRHGRIRCETEFENIANGTYFYDDYVAAIDAAGDNSFDLVLVDGMCRMECVRRGAPKVRPGGILVVDDTDFRFLEPERLLPGWEVTSFWGFKATRDLRQTSFFRRPA